MRFFRGPVQNCLRRPIFCTFVGVHKCCRKQIVQNVHKFCNENERNNKLCSQTDKLCKFCVGDVIKCYNINNEESSSHRVVWSGNTPPEPTTRAGGTCGMIAQDRFLPRKLIFSAVHIGCTGKWALN